MKKSSDAEEEKVGDDERRHHDLHQPGEADVEEDLNLLVPWEVCCVRQGVDRGFVASGEVLQSNLEKMYHDRSVDVFITSDYLKVIGAPVVGQEDEPVR